jgi:hypothetical protein
LALLLERPGRTVDQLGLIAIHGPEGAAHPTFFEIVSETVGVDVEFHLVSTVTDRALIRDLMAGQALRSAVDQNDAVSHRGPHRSAMATFLEVGSESVSMSVNLDMIGLMANWTFHRESPLSLVLKNNL